jgi:hypothetical protein
MITRQPVLPRLLRRPPWAARKAAVAAMTNSTASGAAARSAGIALLHGLRCVRPGLGASILTAGELEPM